MNTPTHKAAPSRLALSTGALFVLSLAVYVFGGLVTVGEPAAAQSRAPTPKIAWTPEAVNVSLPAGQVSTAVASFTPSEDLSGVTLEVVPALRSMVTVTPTFLASVQKGQLVSITLTFAASANALPATLDGTLHVRSGSSTIAKPLPVNIDIVWPTTTTKAGVTFKYPGTYSLHKELNDLTDTVSLTNFGARYLRGGLIPPGGADVVMATLPSPTEGLDAFLAEKLSEAIVESQEIILVDGFTATRLKYVHQFGAHFSMRFVAVYVPVPGALHKIVLAYNFGEPRELDLLKTFQVLLNSVQLPK